jgi:hypothetical protein
MAFKKYILYVRPITGDHYKRLEDKFVASTQLPDRSASESDAEHEYWTKFDQAQIDGYRVIYCAGTVFVKLVDFFTKQEIDWPEQWIIREPSPDDPVGDGDTLIVKPDITVDDFELVFVND